MTVPGEASPPRDIDVVYEVRRRLAAQGPDGREIEVLASRRGTTMRGGGGTGSSVGDGIVGAVIGALLSLVLDAVVDVAADGRPWKVRVYRRGRLLIRRLHKEVLPAGVAPEVRMRELVGEFTGPPSSD
ncbi:MAG: hypothetical protein ABIW49_07825 [Knoellia sp.]